MRGEEGEQGPRGGHAFVGPGRLVVAVLSSVVCGGGVCGCV